MNEFKYFELNERDKRHIIDRVVEVLMGIDEVELAVLFGSFVELPKFRDIDIAVYIHGQDVLGVIVKTADKLEEALGIPTDVVPLNDIPTRFRHYILTHGMVILEKSPGLYEALLSQTIDELILLSTNS